MGILKNLEWRYACKQFDPSKKLSEAQVHTLLESLRLAPSSFGLQPWKFVLVNNPELRAKLTEHSWNQRQVQDASHLIVLCALHDMTDAHVDHYLESLVKERGVSLESLASYGQMMKGFLGKTNHEFRQKWMRDQVYLALGSLLTVCAAEGIDSCPMEGFDPKAYDKLLGLEKLGLKSIVVVPVGYRSPDDKYAQAKKVRYPLQDLVITI